MSNKQVAFSILAFIAVVVYAPFMSLWTLETIFRLSIVYNFWSWLAMSWIHLVIFLARSSPSTSTTINTTIPPSVLQAAMNGSDTLKKNNE